jgi:hypothetical protein
MAGICAGLIAVGPAVVSKSQQELRQTTPQAANTTMPTPTSNRWNANMNGIGRDSEGKQGGEEECELAIGRAPNPLPKLVCTHTGRGGGI